MSIRVDPGDQKTLPTDTVDWIAADLKRSGISAATAKAAGISGRTFPGKRLKDLLGFSRFSDHEVARITQTYLIPYPRVADEPGPGETLRESDSGPEIFFGRLKLKDAIADAKYLSPKKGHCKHASHLYITDSEYDKLSSPKRPLLLVEGEKKALALIDALKHLDQADLYCVIGIAGVRQWQNAPEWKAFKIHLRGRDLILVLDADGAINADVRQEELKMLAWGMEAGANVFSLSWPLIEGKGIDDFLVGGGDLLNLLKVGGDSGSGRVDPLQKFSQRSAREIVDGLKRVKMSRMTAQILAIEIRKRWGDLAKGVLVRELLQADKPKKMASAAKEGGEKGEKGDRDVGPRTWPKIARQYLETLKDSQKRLLLRRWNGAYYVYRGRCYVQVSDELAMAERQRFLQNRYPDLAISSSNRNLEINITGTLLIDESMVKALPAWVWTVGSGRKDEGGKMKDEGVGRRTAEPEPTASKAELTSSLPPERPDPQAIIPVENGLLQIGTGSPPKLLKHTPDYFSTNTLPFIYDAKAKAPGFMEFIRAVCEPEYIDLVQEWGGLCMTPITKFQRFVLIYGSGGNGKGVFTNLLSAVVGAANISSLPIEALNQTNQHLEGIVGKLLNFSGEIRIRADIDDGTLKAITGDDAITINPKYKKPYDYKPQCKIMFSANKVPNFSDKSDAVWRRLMLIPFRRTPKKIDLDLEERLKREELPGIFNWFLEGLDRLLRNNEFTIPDDMSTELARRKRFSDPVLLFLHDYVQNLATGSMPGKTQGAEFYRAYEEWCKENGFTRYKFSAIGLLDELNRICSDGVVRKNAWFEGKTQKCIIFAPEALEALQKRLDDFGGREGLDSEPEIDDVPEF